MNIKEIIEKIPTKTYYQCDNGVLYNADCLDILKHIPEESIDSVITDPPYKISQEGKKIVVRNPKHYKWEKQLDFGEWDRQWESEKEYFEWCECWFKEFARILKTNSWIYIFFDKHKTGIFDLWLAPKYKIKTRCIYIWVKSNPVPSFRKVNWNSGTEFVWVGSKGDCKLKNFLAQKYMSSYYISGNGASFKETEHPTEKPLKLIERLIKVNSNPGEIVLDCFMGSGTTGIVCKELGRKFIGIEADKKYFEIAKERIEKTIYKPELF